MVQFCLAGFVTLLVGAAVTDLWSRRIPNWLSGTLAALYPLYVLAAPTAVAWPMAVAGAAIVFLIGFVLFARGWLGGGDVKLIAAVSLWAGPGHILLFALVTGLAGGVLALGTLSLQRLRGPHGLHLEALGLVSGRPATGPGAGPGAASATLPYGVAIAAGGLAVAANLLTH